MNKPKCEPYLLYRRVYLIVWNLCEPAGGNFQGNGSFMVSFPELPLSEWLMKTIILIVQSGGKFF